MSVEPPKERIFQELGNDQKGKEGIRAIPREKATNFQKFVGKLLGTAVTYNDKEYILKFSSLQKFRANHKEHKALFVRGFVKNVMNFSTEVKSFSQKVLANENFDYGQLFQRLGYDRESAEGVGIEFPSSKENPITWLKEKLINDSEHPKAKQFLDVLNQRQEQHISQAAEKLVRQDKMNQKELKDLAILLEIPINKRNDFIQECAKNNNHLQRSQVLNFLKALTEDSDSAGGSCEENIYKLSLKYNNLKGEIVKMVGEPRVLHVLEELGDLFFWDVKSDESNCIAMSTDSHLTTPSYYNILASNDPIGAINTRMSEETKDYSHFVEVATKTNELIEKCKTVQRNIENLVTVLNSKNQNISKDSLGKLLQALGIEEKGRTSALQAWDENKAPADQKEQFIEILKKIQGWENTLIGVMTIQALSLQNK